MLRREEAQKRLKAFQIADWEDKVLRRVGKLPAKLAEVGRGLFHRDAQGQPIKNWQKRQAAEEAAGKRLNQLPARDRQKLFEALFPRLAADLEAGWQLSSRLPYEVDYDRKAFRAPTDPEIGRAARLRWFDGVKDELSGYDPDVGWVAEWAPHLSGGSGADAVGVLLAAALDAGGPQADALFEVLCDSARGEHETGGMGRHLTRALLVASRPDGWEFMEKMLLAAQRQEGLRQVILETIDEAHPEAFRRMVRLILDNNLVRFSSVVRAVEVWFGMDWDDVTPRKIAQILEKVVQYLGDPLARAEALQKESGDPLYLALWTLGYEDAVAAVAPAAALLRDKKVERRFVAAHFLNRLELPAAQAALVEALDDPDLRVAIKALEALPPDFKGKDDVFDRLLRLLERMPDKPKALPELVWPWEVTIADRREVAGQLRFYLGDRPPTVLLPYLSMMEEYARVSMIELLAKLKSWDGEVRDALFRLAADPSGWVRGQALRALKKCQVTEAEAQKIEPFLSRKNAELRQGVLALLRKQKGDAALASADRLLASKKAEMRLGGLELLRQLVESKQAVAACRARAETYQEARKTLTEQEQNQIDVILDIHRVVPTLDDALGLLNPAERTPIEPPRRRKVAPVTPAALAVIESLDALVQKHAEAEVVVESYDGKKTELLGNLNWNFPLPVWGKPPAEDVKRLPLHDVWEKWYQERPKKLRDRDGLELVRAAAWFDVDADDCQEWQKQAKKSAEMRAAVEAIAGEQPPVDADDLERAPVVHHLLQWLLRMHPPQGQTDFLLDAAENAYALLPPASLAPPTRKKKKKDEDDDDFDDFEDDDDIRSSPLFQLWLGELGVHWNREGEQWSKAQKVRYWRLLHWLDQPAPHLKRQRPNLDVLLAAYEAGAATQADLLDELLGPRGQPDGWWDRELASLGRLTSREPDPALASVPELKALVERCRDRVLEVELARGETPTAATDAANSLNALTGLPTLLRLLHAVGPKVLDRRSGFGQGRLAVLSHLVSITHPAADDMPERFTEEVKAAVKAGRIDGERIMELAFLAPQWVRHVEHCLGWPGLAEGVWWFLAHMPGGRDGLGGDSEDIDYDDEFDDEFDDDEEGAAAPPKKMSPWEQLIRERTPLTLKEIREGAVDAGWFHRVYEALGKKRFLSLWEFSKFGCGDQSHKKAQNLSAVLLGRFSRRELVAGVRRCLKESVRLLGLLPLPADADKREAELLDRYKVLQGYRRYARQLGPMSREGALRAAAVGLENLARTAGYPDPIRLEWAMEAREIADLARGPVTVAHGDVVVALALDDQAQPELTVRRGDRPLKSIPPKVRKLPKVAQLSERKADLKRQASRIRDSLETAMIRGDAFTGAELKQLCAHPILNRQLERLVLLGEGIAGYPVAGGQGLSDFNDKVEPVKPGEKLRLAHPHDLLTGGAWDRWQAHLFQRERVQPFKQVFRELYLVTAQEKADGASSQRYAGQQVNPSQAMALFGARGWGSADGVSKTFYEAGLTASVSFRHHGWTPLEVEGLTLDGVEFTKRGEWKPMPLHQVPPRLFSEVMRDLDLVVSVAHLGGVDPEASASTVQMRAALLRETCSLLRIDNYRVQNNHVLIDGKLGKYSVHLGSAGVHRQPGGALCIVPVHAQQRGRLFLPFADNDPRTAEVLSKVILLARDHEIQDPSILEQLR
jgi:hypothetical protein